MNNANRNTILAAVAALTLAVTPSARADVRIHVNLPLPPSPHEVLRHFPVPPLPFVDVRHDDRYRHRHGTTGHGADHLVPIVAPPSLTVPVIGGRMALGTWQSIALLDTNADNQVRTVRLSFVGG